MSRNQTPRGRSRETSERQIGLLAVVGVAVCCGLPVVVGAGALAAIGGVLCNLWVITAAVVLAVVTIAYFSRRRRAPGADCCPPPPSPAAGSQRGQRLGGQRGPDHETPSSPEDR